MIMNRREFFSFFTFKHNREEMPEQQAEPEYNDGEMWADALLSDFSDTEIDLELMRLGYDPGSFSSTDKREIIRKEMNQDRDRDSRNDEPKLSNGGVHGKQQQAVR
jgi:hypothetical protein